MQATAARRWQYAAAAAAFRAWQARIVLRRHMQAASADASAHWRRRVLAEARADKPSCHALAAQSQPTCITALTCWHTSADRPLLDMVSPGTGPHLSLTGSCGAGFWAVEA